MFEVFRDPSCQTQKLQGGGGEDAICPERLMGTGFMSFCNFGSMTITKTLMRISRALMASDALREHTWGGRRLTLKGEVSAAQEEPGQKAGRHLN